MTETTSISGLLLSIVGLIAAHLVKDIVKATFDYIDRNKKPTRAEFIDLSKALHEHKEALVEQKAITIKMSADLQRVYLFLKVIAGDKWPKYRKQVEDIEREN